MPIWVIFQNSVKIVENFIAIANHQKVMSDENLKNPFFRGLVTRLWFYIPVKPYFAEFTRTVWYQAITTIHYAVSNLIIAFNNKRR